VVRLTGPAHIEAEGGPHCRNRRYIGDASSRCLESWKAGNLAIHFIQSTALGLALHITPVVGLNTGNDLWYDCREPSHKISCLGYIQGVIAGIAIYGDKTPLFCAPDQVALAQAEDIVLRYLAAHVERRQEEALDRRMGLSGSVSVPPMKITARIFRRKGLADQLAV
jgi:Rap1a immunity proteins